MINPINLKSINGNVIGVPFNTLPDVCPICHVSVDPRMIVSDLEAPGDVDRIQVVFQCTKTGCKSFFIADYRIYTNMRDATFDRYYVLDKLYPKTALNPPFS